jgi:hypothetical protein
MIDKIVRLKNNLVMVFDENGEQLPEYQGLYYDVRAKILAYAPSCAVFNHWFGYNLKPQAVPPEEW